MPRSYIVVSIRLQRAWDFGEDASRIYEDASRNADPTGEPGYPIVEGHAAYLHLPWSPDLRVLDVSEADPNSLPWIDADGMMREGWVLHVGSVEQWMQGARRATLDEDAALLDQELLLAGMDAGSDQELLDAGVALVANEDDFWATVPAGARVRLTRVVLYEGPADWIRGQIAKSLPVGVTRNVGRAGAFLRIVQGPFEVLKDND